MFQYSDPTNTGLLEQHGALGTWRQVIHGHYVTAGQAPGSAFTVLEAFDDLQPGSQKQSTTVDWTAFPITANASNLEIDRDRRLQDEYVEWHVARDNHGVARRVTFTTEFREWYAALAAAGAEALVAAIQETIPSASPTTEELFGTGFDPTAATSGARFQRFLAQLPRNPWNNGTDGILALGTRVNSIGALFGLIAPCAVVRPHISPADTCAALGASCVPGRNSDPFICQQAQTVARASNVLSLADPVGIRILRMRGQWRLNGQFIDINDPSHNGGAWLVSRNGRRAVLDLTTGVTLGTDQVESGAEVARQLQVGADVVFAPETAVPAWARTGQESSRAIL